jgi:hypothetical protein
MVYGGIPFESTAMLRDYSRVTGNCKSSVGTYHDCGK